MIQPETVEYVALLDFLFADKPEWNQRCHVFATTAWQGEPRETGEMRPQWFEPADIPYNQIWPDDRLWLLRVLAGEFVVATFQMMPDSGLTGHQLITLERARVALPS